MSERDLTQEELMAWADGLAGVSLKQSAANLGRSIPTVMKWRKRVAEFIAEEFDINEYRLPVYALYPLWLKSVVHNLKKHDTQMTIAIGKGLQILVDKNQTDNTASVTPDELLAIIRGVGEVVQADVPQGDGGGVGVAPDAPGRAAEVLRTDGAAEQ